MPVTAEYDTATTPALIRATVNSFTTDDGSSTSREPTVVTVMTVW